MKPTSLSGAARMILAMVMSGTIGLAVTEVALPAGQVVFYRCFFGAISLGAYCLLRGLIPWKRLRGGTLIMILLGGVFIVTNWVVLFASFRHISIGLATIILHLQPFFVVILTSFIRRELPQLHVLAWIAVAFAGLVLATGQTGSFGGSAGIGIGMAVTSALLYAGATLSSRAVRDVPPEVVALIHTLVGSLLLFPMLDLTAIPSLDGKQWAIMASLGAVYTGLMYTLLYGAYQKLSTAAVAVLAFIYPAAAIVVDAAVYDRWLTMWQIVGLAAILISGLAVGQGWRLRLPRSAPAS